MDGINKITDSIIASSIEIHRELGPGLLESAYEQCLIFSLREKGHLIEHQKPLPVKFRGTAIDCAYRLDIVVDNAVIVEVKAIDQLIPIHQAQLLTYLKLSGISVGLLINFNVKLLKNGIVRLVNGRIS